jgi:hypothetical protein
VRSACPAGARDSDFIELWQCSRIILIPLIDHADFEAFAINDIEIIHAFFF